MDSKRWHRATTLDYGQLVNTDNLFSDECSCTVPSERHTCMAQEMAESNYFLIQEWTVNTCNLFSDEMYMVALHLLKDNITYGFQEMTPATSHPRMDYYGRLVNTCNLFLDEMYM